MPVILVRPIHTSPLASVNISPTNIPTSLRTSKHLRGCENCHSLCLEDCFRILNSASTSFQLKIKEVMHILWEQPSLNSQVVNISLCYATYCKISFYFSLYNWRWLMFHSKGNLRTTPRARHNIQWGETPRGTLGDLVKTESYWRKRKTGSKQKPLF